MLEVSYFDIKTGKPIEESIEGSRQPVKKRVEHSYLEHWLASNQIEAQFSVAKFYESANDSDRQRLESEGRVLVFSSGSDGYFTDAKTAELMTLGSESVSPIYAGNQEAAHNVVAYGSLVSSDGVASTSIPTARILVIDDELINSRRADDGRKPHGDAVLPVSEQQLAKLYDKMGDGTMLVSEQTMQSLLTLEEKAEIALKASERAGVDGDFSTLLQEMPTADAAAAIAERQEESLARRSVVQFRSASPDLPGIAKGTAASSQWCERLGVDAIVSANDIKGDDGRFSTPGIKEVSSFWINRKATAQYGQQTVGPQVKGTIPEATRLEINPKVEMQAQVLAEVAGDFTALSQRYIAQKEKDQARPYADLDIDDVQDSPPDGLYEVLKADQHGQLAGQSNVTRGLNRYVRSEWKKLSTNGTSVPSAMAQHHSQLKPWEVCNRDLPHGALVVYYRSPFPNVGAAAIAINNTEVIKEQDREAFSKYGVVYLPPWTAKNIAITDFDGDMNGFFVGHLATVDDLPQQVRTELSSVAVLSEDQQYEAGRVLFENMVQQLEQGQEKRITPAESPLAVKEFIEKNAPEVKPPTIIKQKKDKHVWLEGEAHSAATWRAWQVTADNPTGKVANAGMSLQALASELKYAPEEKHEALLNQVSSHFSSVLRQADAGKLSIPDDDWLSEQGFSCFYREKLEEVVELSDAARKIPNIQIRREATKGALQKASRLLREVANGPNAVNLQTAVDMAKSSRGIDEALHQFVKALQYKPDEFRQNRNNPEIYMDGQPMPTSTEEPVAWGVQLVNKHYSDVQLLERENSAFESVLPRLDSKEKVEQMKQVALTNNALVRKATTNKARLKQRRSEDQRPTLLVNTSGGRQIILQNIDDEQGTLPIWRADGQPLEGTIRIKQDMTAYANKQFPAQLIFFDGAGKPQSQRIGYVSLDSATKYDLVKRLQGGQKLSLTNPTVTAQVPWAQQHDTDMLYEQAQQHLDASLAPPPGVDVNVHHQETASALWQAAADIQKGERNIGCPGRNIAIKTYSEIMADRLSRSPETKIGRLQISAAMRQQLIEESPHTIQFGVGQFESTTTQKDGQKVTSIVDIPTVYVVKPDGDRLFVGGIAARNPALPEGKTYMAHLSPNKSAKIIDMQIMDLPTVEQSKSQLDSLAEGRSHMTFDEQPYAVYGVREGDIVVARSPDDEKKQIAVQVGTQYRITQKALDTAGYTEQWADKEKADVAELYDNLSQAQKSGKTLWGLTVEPLGDYKAGRVHAFSGELWGALHQSAALEPAAVQNTPSIKESGEIASPEPQHTPVANTVISGRPMIMPEALHILAEHNPLPVNSCVEAMRGYGRIHSTQLVEPYADYGFKQFDVGLVKGNGQQVAFVVGEQYEITSALAADKNYRRFWSAIEKQSPEQLDKLVLRSQRTGQPLWGLKMTPKGDYANGKIVAFPSVEAHIHHPTTGEIKQWYSAARAIGDELLQQRIVRAGKENTVSYRFEFKDFEGKAPENYSSAHSVISVSDKARVEKAISAAKTAVNSRQLATNQSKGQDR